ncbi:MAG: V-type ATP synthase beta chain [Legionella sp.]|uniref:hypothetical protein n=1 Tax=Legionella sp. TaxID=459 RepID=UPI003D10C242
MFVNQASDPTLERLLIPDMALADALKEVGIAMDRVPSNRGYMGDLYSQLAHRYEKACDFQGTGSVTIFR